MVMKRRSILALIFSAPLAAIGIKPKRWQKNPEWEFAPYRIYTVSEANKLFDLYQLHPPPDPPLIHRVDRDINIYEGRIDYSWPSSRGVKGVKLFEKDAKGN